MLRCFVVAAMGVTTSASMADRFYGFRYEIPGSGEDTIALVTAQAQQHACFGWVQPTPQAAVVGEVRCSATHGPRVHAWMEATWHDVRVRVYPSTKIRFHFSYFRRLETTRDTCFVSPPHACTADPRHDEL
ncbi:hypothetical protein SDRG_04031 [Saprolegnia diclina VS20]|uniref:Uncharacterized protein n=1 Tax=Saprolegnia diclina (strain VS20) TaxID=1156394 RepID=T0QUC1_SAPDV|nr:hypothetical protein SDRG_04031 [Saprolegnia diclina VS20]EQC38311.1 hypothetical protein SDRG_04031 [Saprolegnia diclina VS20]|eukprot:XP_008607903.1 hypothetical protein SDRG_04031 [Saprolegnia diclina VS20]